MPTQSKYCLYWAYWIICLTLAGGCCAQEAAELAGLYVRSEVWELENNKTLEVELARDGSFDARLMGEVNRGNTLTTEEIGRAKGVWNLKDGYVLLDRKSTSGAMASAPVRYKALRHLSVWALLPEEERGDTSIARQYGLYPFLWLLLPGRLETWADKAAQQEATEERERCWSRLVAALDAKDEALLAKFVSQNVVFEGWRTNHQSAAELVILVKTEHGAVSCVVENRLDSTRWFEFWPCGAGGGFVTGSVTKVDLPNRKIFVKPVAAGMMWAR